VIAPADPEVSPLTLRLILMETARDIGEPGFDHGCGAVRSMRTTRSRG
jgi:hypothetical protein